MRILNTWIYVGSIDEWVLIDGSGIAPEEHIKILNHEAKQRIFPAKYVKYLDKNVQTDGLLIGDTFVIFGDRMFNVNTNFNLESSILKYTLKSFFPF